MKAAGNDGRGRPAIERFPVLESGFEDELCERVSIEQVQDSLSPELRQLLELTREDYRQQALAERLQCDRSKVRRELRKLYATLRKLLGIS